MENSPEISSFRIPKDPEVLSDVPAKFLEHVSEEQKFLIEFSIEKKLKEQEQEHKFQLQMKEQQLNEQQLKFQLQMKEQEQERKFQLQRKEQGYKHEKLIKKIKRSKLENP
ncbi:hypothetical protein ABEB36_014699 [Hypothenemus hampei]|uniref:Uncharacterized protein n=1 Tax=Hypothenemus hampei TaxID=57062 RepID=A0ABD1E4N8_HYPHA